MSVWGGGYCGCPQKSEEGVRVPGAVAVGSYEPPNMDVASSGPLEKQQES